MFVIDDFFNFLLNMVMVTDVLISLGNKLYVRGPR